MRVRTDEADGDDEGHQRSGQDVADGDRVQELLGSHVARLSHRDVEHKRKGRVLQKNKGDECGKSDEGGV